VSAVAWSPSGRSLWSGGRDDFVCRWDAAGTLTGRSASKAETGLVTGLLLSADGKEMLSASQSNQRTPLWKQYGRWAGRTARLDFDRSLVDDEKVMDKVWKALPVTLGLNLCAIFITYMIAIPWGVWAAVKRAQFFDRASSVVLFMLWSMPSFWVATLLIMGVSSKRNFDWFPSVGLHATNADQMAYVPWLRDWGAHMVLPLIVMTYGSFAGLASYMRTSMLESITQDYVRTARAKGVRERVVIFRHALRNSLVTMVTLLAGILPGMIGGSVIVEIIFSIDGMGYLGYKSILARDYPVIMAITTFSAFLTLLGVLLSDILYSVVDPRIRHE
jgi:peptide/nickel transport system permease protein